MVLRTALQPMKPQLRTAASQSRENVHIQISAVLRKKLQLLRLCVRVCVCVCEQAQTGWALYWFIGVRKPGVPFFSPAAILDKSCNFSLWSFLTCNLKVIPPCTVMFWEVACDNILKFPNSRSQRSLKHVGTYFTGRGHMNLEFGNPKNQGIKETWRSFFLLGFQVKSKHVVLTTVFTSIWKTLCYRKN